MTGTGQERAGLTGVPVLTVALWGLAAIGAVATLLFSIASVVGVLCALLLSDPAPERPGDWGQRLGVFIAFAGLPPLVAYTVARSARRWFAGAALACLVIWAVPLTTLMCWGALALV